MFSWFRRSKKTAKATVREDDFVLVNDSAGQVTQEIPHDDRCLEDNSVIPTESPMFLATSSIMAPPVHIQEEELKLPDVPCDEPEWDFGPVDTVDTVDTVDAESDHNPETTSTSEPIDVINPVPSTDTPVQITYEPDAKPIPSTSPRDPIPMAVQVPPPVSGPPPPVQQRTPEDELVDSFEDFLLRIVSISDAISTRTAYDACYISENIVRSCSESIAKITMAISDHVRDVSESESRRIVYHLERYQKSREN